MSSIGSSSSLAQLSDTGSAGSVGRVNGKMLSVAVKACRAFDSMAKHSYQDINLTLMQHVIERGTFGEIYFGQLTATGEQVAIKKAFQDSRYKNRELHIFYKLGHHPNLVELKYHFYSRGSRGRDDIYLNLVMEQMPESLFSLLQRHHRRGSLPSLMHTKAYMYQLLRAVNYLHSFSICHRDIKSQNVLVCESSFRLKLCDFGSAKEIVQSCSNVAYISSRYYRAPELLFGSTNYSCTIDLWSCGCVLAEMTIGHCLFMANNSLDQLVAIIRILGTPTTEDLAAMNPKYSQYAFPKIPPDPYLNFPPDTPADLLDLLCKLLTYQPMQRLQPLRALTHRFFNDLRIAEQRHLPNGADMPPLFDFTSQELSVDPDVELNLQPLS